MIISVTVERLGDSAEPGGGATGTYHYDFDRDEVLVGRDRATDIRLPHPAVSLVHLRLVRRKGRLWVVDSGSTNGTFLDGRRLEPGKGCAVGPGSRLRVGPFELTLGEPLDRPLTAPNDTARLARQMVLELLGAPGAADRAQPFLEVKNGPDRGRRLALPALGGPLVVGRGEGCALRLSDADASRQHLELQNRGETVELRDLGSKNGVLRNGEPVQGTAELGHGDELLVGNTRLVFGDPVEGMLHDLETERPADELPGSEPSLRELTAGGGIAAAPQEDSPPAIRRPRSVGWTLLLVLMALVVLGAVAGVVWLLL